MPTTTKKRTTSSGRSTTGGSSVASKTSKRSSSASQGGSRSATKGNGTTKSRSEKSSSSSATGASKAPSKSARSASAKSDARATSGAKKKETPKSGAVAKRTASGGAKSSKGRSNSGGSTRSRSAKGKTTAKKKATATNGRKGIIQRVAAAVGGLFAPSEWNVLDLLKRDHRTVEGYFQEVKDHEDANHKETFKKIKMELDAHTHVEETVFYPYLLDVGSEDLKKIVREGIEEHAQVKTLLADLAELGGKDDDFKAKLKVLMENVEHHVEEEEDEMFPLIEDEVKEEDLVLLGERLEEEKADFQGAKGASTAAKSQRAGR